MPGASHSFTMQKPIDLFAKANVRIKDFTLNICTAIGTVLVYDLRINLNFVVLGQFLQCFFVFNRHRALVETDR